VALSVAVVELPSPPPADVLAEPTAFTDVYDEYFAFVWRTARRMGVDPSALEDVCQEVFLVVHRRLGEFEGRSSLRTWLFGIVMRIVQVHRRSLSRKSPAHRSTGDLVDPDTLADRQQAPDEAVSGSEAVRIAHALLDQMHDDKRAVFILSELEDMPAAEVAEAVGANINTVYARLRAARQEFAAAAARQRARDRWRFDQ
jgi:RNA polymerase sigma-70 factor (ECF subfamily)